MKITEAAKYLNTTPRAIRFYDEALSKAVEFVKPQKGESAVDIGIGTGNLAEKFVAKGAKMIGIDQSTKMLEECSRKHPEIETRIGHFLALPLINHQVDFVVSSYALHHIPDEEKLLALEEMSRVIKDNGRICIVDLMFENADDRRRILEQFEKAGNHEAVYAIKDEYYADRSRLVDWFSKQGFKIDLFQFNDILHLVYAEKGGEKK